MRILLIGAVFFGLLGHAIHAQTTIVRSGEHETFSRLTLQLPKGATWDISQGQRSAILAIMNPKLGFDTSQVFERMPKTRLVGLSKNEKGDELRLEFGCDCELTWFTMARGLLVIDINDPENEPFQFRSALLPTGRLPYRFGGATILSQPEINATEPLLPNRVSQSRYEPTLPADPEGIPGVRGRRVGANENISERRLLAQIGRAANQGLLTPLVPLVPKVERVARDAPELQASSTSTEPILPININAATSIDLGLSQAAGAISNADNGQECVSPSLVMISSWADERSFSDQISELRSALFDELDRLDHSKAMQLARVYLHFGFGTEALDVLNLVQVETTEIATLQEVAHIMDDMPSDLENPFAGQQHCESDIAMWAVFSQPQRFGNVNKDAVQRAFARLPTYLRTHLGPRLSEIFSQTGDVSRASAILRHVNRADDVTTPGEDYATAVISKSNNEIEKAAKELESVVESNSEYSPKALVELIESNLDERRAIAPELAGLAGAFAAELRDSEIGPELNRAHAIAQALSGDFDNAFEIVRSQNESGPSAETVNRVSPLLLLAVENADDITFLKHALIELGVPDHEFSPELGNALARRLLDLGFADQAVKALSISREDSEIEAQRLLRAEASIEVGLPHRALVELLSLSSTDAKRLKAKAMWLSGDYEMAGRAMLDAEMIDEAVRGFWLADVSDMVPDDGQSTYVQLVEITQSLERDSSKEGDLPPLADARALLENSQAVRRQIETLLVAVPTQ